MNKYLASFAVCSNLFLLENKNIPDLKPSIITGMLTSQRHLDIHCNATGRYSLFSDLRYPLIYRKKFNFREKDKAFLFCQALFNRGHRALFTISRNLSHSSNNILGHLDNFDKLWEKYASNHQAITIELYQQGDACKIFFKKNHILGIYLIVPAFVVGDGNSSLSLLIEKLIEARKKNICYKSYPLENFLIERKDYIPLKNEVVQVGNSRHINFGACYLNLTELLKGKYQNLIEDIGIILPTSSDYTELTFFSRDIFEGVNHDSFYISEIQQNVLNLTHLFSCVDNENKFNDLVLSIESTDDIKQVGECFFKDVNNSSFLTYASPENILRNAAIRMGLSFKSLGGGLSLIVELESGRKRGFFYGMSQYTSYIARKVSNNKMLTKKLLKENRINTPDGKIFKLSEFNKAKQHLSGSIDLIKWVLKPLQGSGGVGVTTGISNFDDLNKAWNVCRELNCRELILEEEVSGNDYRIVVIQDNIFSVTQRIAAYVVGDGVSTIDQLIKVKAQQRKKNPFYAIKKFEANQIMINFLLKKGLGLDSIPDRGERIQLIDAVNIGSGGESIDRTDEIHPEWREIAIKARKTIMNAYHVGLDVMASDISKSPDDQSWSIIEVNTNPDLGLVLFPGTGAPRDIGKALITSIFGGLLPKEKIGYKLTILGKVQNVGFRKWFKRICDLREVSGKVWNDVGREDIVRAKVYGYEAALEEIIMLTYKGSASSIVKNIIIENWKDNLIEKEFNII